MIGLDPKIYTGKTLLFLTGKLAAPMLRQLLPKISSQANFRYEVEVLPITVAALMTTNWVEKRLPKIEDAIDLVVLPGYCHGPLDGLGHAWNREVLRGPSDLRRLPELFGRKRQLSADYENYDIEILAEINHAPKLSVAEVVEIAAGMVKDGADWIDLGSIPNYDWANVGDYVQAVRALGAKVSIDSFSIPEIEKAVAAGAEQVLSVNSSNRDAAADWNCRVVVVPDEPAKLQTLHETTEFLLNQNVPVILDPILEPIGCGFTRSLERYMTTRRRYPDLPMMMGIGNITELTDADSAGINVLLLGICQELQIHQVLTTQVIQWAQSSVKECDLGRRLVRESIRNGVPPKHIEPNLILLRDATRTSLSEDDLSLLQAAIKDSNYRIFADDEKLHLLSSQHRLSGTDPFELFDELSATNPKNLSASHAFYLGYELCKAMTALSLNKEYNQDEALDWGFLTVDEKERHRLKLSGRKSKTDEQES